MDSFLRRPFLHLDDSAPLRLGSGTGSAPKPEAERSLSISLQVGVGFALIYVLMQYYPPLAALAILALLPCILLRVDESQRRIAQAPLTFATLMLTKKVFSAQIDGLLPGYSFSSWWMPLFLAVCLFYMPATISWSRNMLVVLGTVLLLTGLLPG